MEKSALTVPARSHPIPTLHTISGVSMHPYQESGDDTGIAAYEIAARSITIRFKHGGTYLYNYSLPGRTHVEAMKSLAQAGDGLNTYINQHVRENYPRKIN